MFIGDVNYPCDFGFFIERIPEWEDDTIKNGFMFMMINSELYPKSVRTTTLSCEFADLLAENSAMKNPVIDKELYHSDSETLFTAMAERTHGKDYDALYDLSFLIPFQEITDEGWNIFIISDGDNIKLMAGRWHDEKLLYHDEIEMPAKKYFDTIAELENTLKRNGGH
ncbi:MAG: immunity 42 family protein [Ruminococcus sp.]|uniref:immunity 42 family protein n=1 Tax=Ruminococcus sp. TaxID=41978 RepID=UPI0025F7E1E3|nr:immunity 42 family protein [Ruminococcus sp.]MCR5541959.1 immunity 42 family protein [Ruminococcus sp.]